MHHAVDVQALDCDFYVFSGHKLYGPTGIGVLYVKEAAAGDAAVGRGRVDDRHRQPDGRHHLAKAPWRFEAGTPNTGGIIGLARRWITSARWG
jgi:cysteine desulfurase/selenocysteine lyase